MEQSKLIRDPDSGAILNQDLVAYEQRQSAKNLRRTQEREFAELKERVECLEILVQQLLRGNK